MGNQPNLLKSLFSPAKAFSINETEKTQNQLSQQLTLHDIEMKRFEILRKTNNDPKTERDFRKTCALYKNQKFASGPQLTESYQKYISAYQKLTFLYLIFKNDQKYFLKVFDTENTNNLIYKLDIPESLSKETCLTLLPDGELFCFGDSKETGITLIIGSNYKTRILPVGMPCVYSSAIYFNRNVYCFGGIYDYYQMTNLSMRFDLDENRWVDLTPMPEPDSSCSSAIFKGNILISGWSSKNLLLYSIDIDSFSVIPYEFADFTKKIIINAGGLYLIEFKKDNGFIYENEAGDEYSWKKITKSRIGATWQVYCSYNNGGIYIASEGTEVEYYKFDLRKKKFLKL